jgi:transposase-like protein
MKGHGAKFGRKKELAIAALLTNRSVEDAARAVDLNHNTLLKWLKIPVFLKEYRAARREVVTQAVARLQQATGAAGMVMLKLMTDPNVPAAVRLRAAECVFDRAIKGVELEDIEARVAELEWAAEAAVIMTIRNIVRRLERLETHLAPPSDEPAMVIHMTCVGHPDRIIEVHGDYTAARRREPWSPRRGFKDGK